MNIEEKAKAYDEALERARKQRDNYQKELNKTDKNSQLVSLLRAGISAIELAFPQLAESEDEKIRHWLIGLISADYKDENFPSGIKKTNVLNWLKKESVVYEQGMYYYTGKKFLYCQQEKPNVATPTLDSVKQNNGEDERILASIVDCIGLMGEDGDVFSNHNVTKVQVLSWLEKHNEEEIKKIRNEEYTNGFNDAAGFGKQKDLTTVTIPL